MQLGERFSLFLKILLPFLVLLLFKVSPASYAVLEAQSQARAAQAVGDHGAAAEALLQWVTHEPWRTALWEQAGREAQAAGQLEAAASALRTAAEHNHLSADGQFLLGEIYLQQDNLQAAEAAWQEDLRVNGPSTRVFERLIDVQAQRGDNLAVVQTLNEWRAFEPSNPRVAYQLGLYLTVIDPRRALPLLLEAAKADTSYTPAVQLLRTGLSTAIQSDNPAYGWLMIGRPLGSIGRWDLAAAAFQQSVNLAPDYAEAWAFLGEARYQLEGAGKTELDRARSLNPDSTVVNTLYAMYLRRQSQDQAALAFLQAVAEKEPKQPYWQVEIGSTLAKMGDLEAARQHFEAAIALAPENSLYWQYLAQFSITQHMDIQNLGLSAARKAVLLSPDDAGALDTMGQAFMALEDNASAERFLQQAIDRDATYAPAYLHIGQLYLQQADRERARINLKQAASLAGDNDIGLYARRLLNQYFGEAAASGQ